MPLYNPNIIFASQTSNRQELTPTQLEQGYVRQSQISSAEQNGSEYLKSLGLSQLYLIGDQYQSVIKYSYGMSCSIVYAASATNVYIRRFIVKNESAWQTPITNTPPLKNASTTTEGDISFWNGGTLDDDNWQEITQNVDNTTIIQRNGVLSVAGAYQTAIGELKMGLWDIGEQPWGFYPLLGDTYPITSAVAKQVQNHAPASIKRLFRIQGTTITFPDFADPMTEANEFGYFPRFARVAGQTRGDAIRNIWGEIYTTTRDKTDKNVFTQTSDCLNVWPPGGSGGLCYTNFDASKVVPTASENRPQSFTVIPYMYLGVDYEAPASDPQDEYIAGKMLTKLGYVQPYTGTEQVGYYNKFIEVTAGTTYCINPVQCTTNSGTLAKVVPPLPQTVLDKYGIGLQYDSNYQLIGSIKLWILYDDPVSTNNKRYFYYFVVSDLAKYIKLNMEESQLATYRISKAVNLWNADTAVQDGTSWMMTNIPTIDDETQTYYKQYISYLRLHTPNTGYNINAPRPQQSYFGVWQDFKSLYSQGTIDQFTLYNIWAKDADKAKACFFQIYPDNIYTAPASAPPPHSTIYADRHLSDLP